MLGNNSTITRRRRTASQLRNCSDSHQIYADQQKYNGNQMDVGKFIMFPFQIVQFFLSFRFR